jgi:hypothetical protein
MTSSKISVSIISTINVKNSFDHYTVCLGESCLYSFSFKLIYIFAETIFLFCFSHSHLFAWSGLQCRSHNKPLLLGCFKEIPPILWASWKGSSVDCVCAFFYYILKLIFFWSLAWTKIWSCQRVWFSKKADYWKNEPGFVIIIIILIPFSPSNSYPNFNAHTYIHSLLQKTIELRKKKLESYLQKCISSQLENDPLLREFLELERYDSYAANRECNLTLTPTHSNSHPLSFLFLFSPWTIFIDIINNWLWNV